MAENKSKAFMLYYSQWNALKELSLEDLGLLLSCIFRTLRGEDADTVERCLTGEVKLAFRFMMIQIGIDLEKYETKAEQNRLRQEAYRKQKLTVSSNAQKENENESRKEREIESAIEIEKESESESRKENENGVEVAAATTAENLEKWDEWFKVAFVPKINDILKESNIPKIRQITPQRRTAIFALRKIYTWNDIIMIFKKAASSDFLNNRSPKKSFQATFDWIVQEKNALAILEGNFS